MNGAPSRVRAHPMGRGATTVTRAKRSAPRSRRRVCTGRGRLSLHSLRHAFASLLIAKGLNVVFVSRQLGHSSPAITLRVYAHLFEQADHAVAAREALQASYEAMTRVARPSVTQKRPLQARPVVASEAQSASSEPPM